MHAQAFPAIRQLPQPVIASAERMRSRDPGASPTTARRWVDETTYAHIVALCQFLPGLASSQVGIVLGLMRAGALGAVAAWVGFTLPSAIARTAFAYGLNGLPGITKSPWVHGLLVAAVAVVASAIRFGRSKLAVPRTLKWL